MQNNVNTNISWYERHNYKKFGQKIKIFKIVCTKYMASSEAMTSSTHSFAYSYGLVKKCFLKICETSKCHNFLIFQPIFIRFSLFCSENFTLSSEIKLDQLRTSPLKLRSTKYRTQNLIGGLHPVRGICAWSVQCNNALQTARNLGFKHDSKCT